MNLIAAIRAGVPGIILTALFLIIHSYMFFLDRKVLNNDGIVGLPLMNVAGISTSTPAALVTLYPVLETYSTSATSEILLVCVITSILTPIIAHWQFNRYYGREPREVTV